MKIPPLNLQLIYERGRPVRAVIDIAALEALLEAAEDLDDIEYLNSLKSEDLDFVSFDDYLNRRQSSDDESMDDRDSEHGDLHDRHREAG